MHILGECLRHKKEQYQKYSSFLVLGLHPKLHYPDERITCPEGNLCTIETEEELYAYLESDETYADRVKRLQALNKAT
jgi:hypothetical protein